MDDVKQFVSELNQVPASISQIATAAAELEIALRGFNDGATLQARGRLVDLLVPLTGFQEFLSGRKEDRDRAIRARLAEASKEDAKNVTCIDNYIMRDIANPKNTALNKLRVQLDVSVKSQHVSEIEKANSIVTDFFQTNGIPCQLTPVVPPAVPPDTALLRTFGVYLVDVQAFLRTQPNVAQEQIADIARFAALLREAIIKSAESEAKQFKARLDDFT